jgi:hypothetical protein
VKIHSAIIAAMADIAKTGIAKTSRADLGGAKVNYRGIEAAMNEMSGILIRHGISVTPAYSDLTITDRAKADPGKFTRFVTVKGCFTFEAEDGSSVQCITYGEAMDSGDKATIKAQSVAFRTALFQQFVVPTMAIDPEIDGDDGDELLDRFRAAALQGTTALRALFTESKPDDAFWKKHAQSLRAAATEADKERAPE